MMLRTESPAFREAVQKSERLRCPHLAWRAWCGFRSADNSSTDRAVIAFSGGTKQSDDLTALVT